jgi:hypothetical protein
MLLEVKKRCFAFNWMMRVFESVMLDIPIPLVRIP